MKKILRANALLTMNEYNEIKDYLKGDLYGISISKKIEVLDGKEKYRFELKITHNSDMVFLTIKSISSNITDKKGDFFMNYKKISQLIGVKKCVYNTPKAKLSFYFNLDKEYDRKTYPDKYDYYKSKLNILKWRLGNNPKEAYLELAYADFTKENELALASYSLLACPYTLLDESNSFDLFENKLNFIGNEIDDFVKLSRGYSTGDIEDFLNEEHTDNEVLDYLIGYVAFIKLSTIEIEERTDVATISKLGYEIYDKYISLY